MKLGEDLLDMIQKAQSIKEMAGQTELHQN